MKALVLWGALIGLGATGPALGQSVGNAPLPSTGGSPAGPPIQSPSMSSPTPSRAAAPTSGDVYATPLSIPAVPAAAQGVGSVDAGLPPDALARTALEAHPDVVAARARLDGARAQADRLRVGEHETTLEGASGVRHVADYYSIPGRSPGATVVEGYVGVQRAFRLPGKAALDRKTGDLGVEAAADEVDDARHQTGLLLADAWFTWIQASAEADLDRSAVEGADKAMSALRRRVDLKDAAPLDLQQVEAASAVARVKSEMSAGDALAARLALEGGFPELRLPVQPPVLPEPVDPVEPPGGWQQAILARSHEIRIAELKADQQRAIAERAGLDRRGDPTFGLRTFVEQGSREKGVQATVSIPFGGERRSAIFAGELARVADLEAQTTKVRRDIVTTAGRDVAAVASRIRAWRAAKAARAAGEIAARLQFRAYQLGERDLSESLLSNGQFYQAMRAEIASRVDAWRAMTRLRLDAHALWADED